MPPIDPMRQFELTVQMRSDLPSHTHTSFVALWRSTRAAALAAAQSNFHTRYPYQRTQLIQPPVRPIIRPTLLDCLACGTSPFICGRTIARDGSIWPARDTGFRMGQQFSLALSRSKGVD